MADLIRRVPAVGAAVVDATDAYSWTMCDVRSDRWVDGRIALCGDSAVGFLPTAGVGASMAMRAASGLADELSRTDAASVPLAFDRYEKRSRSIIERNQTESRRLAHLMFVRRPAVAWVRDRVARHYPAERVLGQIIHSMHEPF